MSHALIRRAAVLLCFVAFLGASTAGQSPKKPAPKKPAGNVAGARTEPKPAPAPTDMKVRTRTTSGAQVSENSTYVKGARQRVEFPGAVTIQQCDLGRSLLINPASKTYLVQSSGDSSRTAAAAPTTATPASAEVATVGQKPPAARPEGGVVTYTTTLTDTGERKQMFGREARHIKTVVTREAGPSACDRSAMTMDVDGWYIDVPVTAQCPIALASPAGEPKADSCVDKVESVTKGDAKLGFPLAMTTTTRTGEGDKQETTTSTMEVTAFEMTTLDAALFDVPAGYTEVRNVTDMMAGFQASGGLSDALLGSTADGTSAAAPKQAGAIRIGVLEPVDKSTHNLPTRELRQELAANFHNAPFEALTLAGNSVAASQASAAGMHCDYLLYSEITGIKTSKPGKMGSMLKKVSHDGPPRDVHEVTLDYKLYPVGAAGAAPAFSDTAKATSGGSFNVHSALHLAMTAGSLYLRFTGLGMISPMLMSNFGGRLGPLATSGLVDPRMSAMMSITQMLAAGAGSAAAAQTVGTAGAGEDSELVIRQTVGSTLVNVARGTMEQLQKNKK